MRNDVVAIDATVCRFSIRIDNQNVTKCLSNVDTSAVFIQRSIRTKHFVRFSARQTNRTNKLTNERTKVKCLFSNGTVFIRGNSSDTRTLKFISSYHVFVCLRAFARHSPKLTTLITCGVYIKFGTKNIEGEKKNK